MPWTQTDVDNLKEAIATGQKRVRVNGGTSGEREIEYQTTSQMLAVLSVMEQEVAAANHRPIRRQTRLSMGSGL